MEDADIRLAKNEKQKKIERMQQAEQRVEQAEISKIVKQEREEKEQKRLIEMEKRQQIKAEEALASKQKHITRTVLKTMIREEISTALTKENKEKIQQQRELEVQTRIKRYNSAQSRSQHIREQNLVKEPDNERFDHQNGNLAQIEKHKKQMQNEREAEMLAKVDRALKRKEEQARIA